MLLTPYEASRGVMAKVHYLVEMLKRRDAEDMAVYRMCEGKRRADKELRDATRQAFLDSLPEKKPLLVRLGIVDRLGGPYSDTIADKKPSQG